MRRIKTLALLLSSSLLLAACLRSSGPIQIDKSQKAIISIDGSPIIKVVIDGGGKEVTLQSFGDPKGNSIIYFNRHNPGFLVTEGFGLNKNYFLALKPSSKYSVNYYKSANDQPYTLLFRTDYNGNIIDNPDDN